MGLIRSRVEYDRTRILDAAARARSSKKRERAIELYRWVLAVEPQNAELHGKLGPLLAETGQHFDAWASFRTVARLQLRDGHADNALAVYREAALYLPQEVDAWQAIARLQAKRGQRREAVETLLEGSRQFRTRWLRPQAIHLLRRARDLDPWNFEVVIDLACLLAMQGQGREAHMLLDGLVLRSGGERLRRVRAAQLRIRPTPRAAWRWLEATLRPQPEPAPAPAAARRRPAGVVPIREASARRA